MVDVVVGVVVVVMGAVVVDGTNVSSYASP